MRLGFCTSPALKKKKYGYTGFATSVRHSFRHSIRHSFPPPNHQINFHHTFLKNCKGYKIETRYTHTQWVDLLCIRGQGPITLGVTSLSRFYNLPLMKTFVTDFSGPIKVVMLKLGTHMNNGLMYRVY